MSVVAIPLRNAFDHINYLVVCPDTGEALSIDPYDVDRIMEEVGRRGLRVTAILSTHEHWDHAGRNAALRERTGALVMAPRAAAGTIEQLDRMLVEGDEIRVGSSVSLRVIATPGHTMTHISLLGEAEGRPYLLCGDTMFAAGVGNCGYGGHAPTLFDTVHGVIDRLPDETLLYPGHDYLRRNLAFTLSVEPDNRDAAAMAAEPSDEPRFTTLGEERRINCFLRLRTPAVRDKVGGESDLDTFLRLRKLRDGWA